MCLRSQESAVIFYYSIIQGYNITYLEKTLIVSILENPKIPPTTYFSPSSYKLITLNGPVVEYVPLVLTISTLASIHLFEDNQVLGLYLELINLGIPPPLISFLAPKEICQVQPMLELVCNNMLHQHVRCILRSVNLLK